MATMPSYQLYPRTSSFIDSFQTTRLRFFRYSFSTSFTSIPLKNQYLCKAHSSKDSTTAPHGKRSNFELRNRKKSWDFAGKATDVNSKSSWLSNWNETHVQKRLNKPQQVVLNYRKEGDVSSSDCEDNYGSSGIGSGSTMERIVQKLKKFGYIEEFSERKENERKIIEKGSVEDIFYVEEGLLPNARGGFSDKSPFGDENNVFVSGGEVRFPWEKEVEKRDTVRQKSRTSLAELTLPEPELRRLRNLAMKVKSKTRITGAGVTQQVVEMIRDKWKSSEVVKLKIEGAPALNMRRMHEILERKTGGLVIWRSGTSVALYRGVSYENPSTRSTKQEYSTNEMHYQPSAKSYQKAGGDQVESEPSASGNRPAESLSIVKENKDVEIMPEVKYEDEIDKLLDVLGPRYTDWPGGDPLPIDADLLPGVVPGYQSPFRILPYGVKSTLATREATALRRLARALPPHFALGRSRQHQGLASAMIKLWERSSIAKVALKRGVQLTTSERMAEDIKKLTGGVLLSRNKDFLVFYRGKDFLSPDVAEALLEKERLAKALQDQEEQARVKASTFFTPSLERSDQSGVAGSLGETLNAKARWGKRLDDADKKRMMREAEILRHADLVRKLEKKLSFAERKLVKAEQALSKVEEFLNPADQPADPQSITDEERFMFRKLGLRMKAFLLLGRRGVFDGTVENMHLHWKYRELVKIIVKAKNFEEVKNIALSLEAESGGVLVSVDKVSKGYAIIVFRGKDYQRPSSLRPKNLLTKRKALARSIELQRREALLNHMSTLQARVHQLTSEIEHMATLKDRGDEELYNKLDLAYPTEDEDSEDERDDSYLEIYDSDNNAMNGNQNTVDDIHSETDFPFDLQTSQIENS